MQHAQEIFGVDFDFVELDNAFDEDQDDEDAYEDETEEGAGDEEAPRKNRKRAGRKSIFDIYEPSELEKSHLTDRDKKIREQDVPERFLTRRTPIRETIDDAEIEEEAEWIYTMAFNTNTLTIQKANADTLTPLAGQKDPSVILKIREVLSFMRKLLLEVPFIATYRKEYITGNRPQDDPDRPKFELDRNDLWTIYQWDEKYCQFRDRRTKLLTLYQNMQTYQFGRLALGGSSEDLIPDDYLVQVKNLSTFEELQDWWLHFQLFYSHDLPAMKQEIQIKEKERRREERETKRLERIKPEDGTEIAPPPEVEEDDTDLDNRLSSLKLAHRKDAYTICRELGVGGLASKYGLTANQLGENIRDQYTKNEVVQYEREPLDAAQDYVCTRFPTPQTVLVAARSMVAKEIACNPIVRKCMRTAFVENGRVNCRPTPKGLKEGINDETHPSYPFKYLKGKPIGKFAGDTFVNLMIAEADGQIELELTVDQSVTHGSHTEKIPYLNEIRPLYHKVCQDFLNNFFKPILCRMLILITSVNGTTRGSEFWRSLSRRFFIRSSRRSSSTG